MPTVLCKEVSTHPRVLRDKTVTEPRAAVVVVGSFDGGRVSSCPGSLSERRWRNGAAVCRGDERACFPAPPSLLYPGRDWAETEPTSGISERELYYATPSTPREGTGWRRRRRRKKLSLSDAEQTTSQRPASAAADDGRHCCRVALAAESLARGSMNLGGRSPLAGAGPSLAPIGRAGRIAYPSNRRRANGGRL